MPELAEGSGFEFPDSAGWWTWFPPDGDEAKTLEVYPLDPVGGTLCVWGPDFGFSYSGVAETQLVWTTDEWQGHIPVTAMGGRWFKSQDPVLATQPKEEVDCG